MGCQTERLPATKCGYLAKHLAKADRETSIATGTGVKAADVAHYLQQGYGYVEWTVPTGVLPIPLLDEQDRVVAVLAGRPKDDDTYIQACAALYEDMSCYTDRALFPGFYQKHRSGKYPTADSGITYAQGDTSIHNLKLGPLSQATWALCQSVPFVRTLGFANSESSPVHAWPA
ncbi:hypothetical protein P691DRAFT_769976 [Macrolepiota fuliginosa MF-IS2]|uniref:Uncharacterized protein n=1 Tax=Macrolepiota fuliginosa MF-IS2 TaxID=1400762 RepID=A0A9P5WWD4_9AGAR|nr:hypothetical protein P691DRAFT_769976 [Macrolepiota fuliginosa MF-IS2]